MGSFYRSTEATARRRSQHADRRSQHAGQRPVGRYPVTLQGGAEGPDEVVVDGSLAHPGEPPDG
jgi:hypothetical protein